MMTISDIIEIIVVCALIFFPLGYLARHYGWNHAYIAMIAMALVGMAVFLLMWGAGRDGYETDAE